MKRHTIAMFGVLLFFQAAVAAQEENGMEGIQARLKLLEERLQRLEQRAAAADPAPETAELRRQLDLLASEVEKLRSGEPESEERVPEVKAASLGLGGSAASVYGRNRGASIAGYGEMAYERYGRSDQAGLAGSKPAQFDFVRAILYAGYRFNDRFVFNSEIEFEHASTGRGGEASVEFAYVEYLAGPHLSLRGGLVLVPMGLTNEFHEPTAFLGVRRSETETVVIPSTWRENGFGVLGTAGMLQYRAYVLNGLDAAGFSSDGIRGGRQKGARARASDLAVVARADLVPSPGVMLGGSVYRGDSGQERFPAGGDPIAVPTTIGEVHGQVQKRGFDLRGLYARTAIGDAAALNNARALVGQASVGERLHGGYVQLGYNVLARVTERARLTPFYRFERVNTQLRVPAAFLADPARNRVYHTAGLEYRPIYGIVLKTDYQWVRNRARTGRNQLNVGLGYAF